MFITESVFLLMTDTDGRALTDRSVRDHALVGAMVADLLALGRLELSDDKDPRLHLTDSSPTGSPFTDQILSTLAPAEGKKLSAVVGKHEIRPVDIVAPHLAEQGVIRVETTSRLGLKCRAYPTQDPSAGDHLRTTLTTALTTGRVDTASAAVLGILSGAGVLNKALRGQGPSTSERDLKRRVEGLHIDSSEGQAVARAMQRVNAGIVAATIAAGNASSS